MVEKDDIYFTLQKKAKELLEQVLMKIKVEKIIINVSQFTKKIRIQILF
jgi:hypothetical protein